MSKPFNSFLKVCFHFQFNKLELNYIILLLCLFFDLISGIANLLHPFLNDFELVRANIYVSCILFFQLI